MAMEIKVDVDEYVAKLPIDYDREIIVCDCDIEYNKQLVDCHSIQR